MRPPGRKYVDSPSLQVFPPPSLCQDVTQFIFFLKGKQDRLQALCDTFLNEPSGGAVHYRPRLPFVILTFQHVGRLSSAAEGFQDWGYTSEREVTFWIAASDYQRHGADELCKRVELFVPYIYTDNPWAVAGGRELYGFPKQAADIRMPGTGQDAGAFEVRTLAYRTFRPDTRAEVARLLLLERADGQPFAQEVAGAFQADNLLQQVGLLRDELGPLLDFNFEMGSRIVDFLFRPSLPMVFLKQFRDVGTTTGACYQAIVGAAADQIKLRGLRLLPKRFRLTIDSLASQPIAEDLGLELNARGQVSIAGAIQLQFDFRLNEGHLIWSGT
ncbi:acetoacetate decarboxylase family protein [Stigmatella sp. ncwal1]|uniref:Acetoacetate decarboxylase family protein n=1 Tax=Stigmatella ashevillensis TaxID=2995309 RepID=A0ABT5D6J8_9BACT|nr:acetoacetate decarboxylase family protein [Stigmatella ashevillena]MDC0707867.1 acetoacetate decarboxylase family protein [Stigmatella ashevillena]